MSGGGGGEGRGEGGTMGVRLMPGGCSLKKKVNNHCWSAIKGLFEDAACESVLVL